MLDRKLAPSFQKTLSLILPEPIQVPLSSGSYVWYTEGIKQNIVKVEVVFTAGKWGEPVPGLSHFTSMMLEKGTAGKTSAELAEALDRYGANLEINPGFDFVSISLYSLKSKLKEIFPVFLELITEPRFPEKEWVQMREIFLQNLKVNQEKTGYVASKLIRQNIFGPAHPYGSSIEEVDVMAIRPDQFHAFFTTSFALHSAYLVGSLDATDLEVIRRGLNSLPRREPVVSYGPAVSAAPFAQRVTRGDRLQASVRLGKRSVLKTDFDYPAVLLATHVLGGFFGSRLMKNIREEKGLTYGISASLNTLQRDSLFIIGADVNRENVSVVIDEVKKELLELGSVVVPEQELLLAKNHFIGSLQTDLANPFSVGERIKTIHLNGLPGDYYQHLLLRIDGLTSDGIQQATEKHLNREMLFEVAVG
jgi:zinc protease